ncbi:hypothetical protein MTO96_012606 [Rhipicephalus appendiculatus]
MGDSVDGFGYQRCPLPPEETVLRKITGTHLPFPVINNVTRSAYKRKPATVLRQWARRCGRSYAANKVDAVFCPGPSARPLPSHHRLPAHAQSSTWVIAWMASAISAVPCLRRRPFCAKSPALTCPFPSSTTSQDLLIKESPQRFFGSGHGDAAGAMLLTKSTLFFVQALLLVPAVASSAAGTCSEFNMGDSVDGFGYQRCPLPPEETVLRKITGTHLPFPSSTTVTRSAYKRKPATVLRQWARRCGRSYAANKVDAVFCPGPSARPLPSHHRLPAHAQSSTWVIAWMASAISAVPCLRRRPFCAKSPALTCPSRHQQRHKICL